MIYEQFAPAKVNLALHVTGRRPDGYHLLETVVAFPAIGDRLTAVPSETLSLSVEGPFAAALGETEPEDNLVLKAARALAERTGRSAGARLVLHKVLPVASGIGGGSADAAAALRLLCTLWDVEPDAPDLHDIALSLGADVPMCLASRPLVARGIGEAFSAVPDLPEAGIVLVNPGVSVATPEVFAGLERRHNPPLPACPEHFADAVTLADWLRATRNDLENPAIDLCPQIASALALLDAHPECLLGRMSGSGATCFGLFREEAAARTAAAEIKARHPGWWATAAALRG